MIKNISILVLGILIGMGTMSLIQIYQDLQEENSSLRQSMGRGQEVEHPQLNIDPSIEKLVGEELSKTEDKNWFVRELNKMESDAQGEIDKMNSAGDDAAKMFEQFSTPAEEKPFEQE